MNKLVAATGIALSAAITTPAFAQGPVVDAQVQVTAGTATSADLACMSAAVTARETATIDARADLQASLSAAAAVRKSALIEAYTIADNQDRAAAIVAAWSAYVRTSADAYLDYRASVKEANEAFVEASADCNIDSDVQITRHTKEADGDRGWHKGWFKNGHKKWSR